MPEPLDDKRIAEFRQLICDTATRQIGEGGVESLSMRSLAKALGYSATALYSYYRNRDEILAAARAAACRRLSLAMAEARQGLDDPDKGIRAVARAYQGFASQEPAAYQLIMLPNQQTLGRYPDVEAGLADIRRQFARCLDTLARKASLDADPEALAQVLWASLHGAIALGAAGALDSTGMSFDDFLATTLDTALAGLTGSGERRSARVRSDPQFSLDL